MDLDRTSHTPLYIQFYELLKAMIGSRPVGANLPPERVLCDQFGLDRATVRRALAMLSDDRLIERLRGCGTRIIAHPATQGGGGTILFALYHGAHLVDRLGEPFYARSMEALERQLQKDNMRLVYSKVNRRDNLQQLCETLDVQGVILAGTVDEQMAAQCKALGIPLVGYNTRIADMLCVLADNEDGAALAARHLLSLGHRRTGFINAPGYTNAEKRLSRFQSEMRKAGLDTDMLTIADGDWSTGSGYEAAKQILTRAPDTTAIFGGNDAMAIGAMRAAVELGLRVPEDMSIIGFDGTEQSARTDPPLATLQVDVKVMAEAACMLLAHRMNGGMSTGIEAIASVEFLPRDSTAAPATTYFTP